MATKRCKAGGSGRSEVILTLPQLKKLCKEWQKILRLQDWDIELRLVTLEQMGNDAQGCIMPSLPNKTAVMFILDQGSYTDDIFPQDMEETLVHELVHLHTAPFCPEDETFLEEQAVELMASALVAVKRANSKGE